MPPSTLQYTRGKCPTSVPCTRPTCTGPLTCLHRFVPAIPASVVRDWRRFDLPAPFANHDTHGAKKCVAALFRSHARAADWIRSGATLPVLSALNVHLDDLVAEFGLETLTAPTFNLTGADLCMFRWSADALGSNLYPAVLMPRDLTATVLCRDYGVTYTTLIRRLNQAELWHVGFRGPHYKFIGTTTDDVFRALDRDPSIRHLGGARTWLDQLGFLDGKYLTGTPSDTTLRAYLSYLKQYG